MNPKIAIRRLSLLLLLFALCASAVVAQTTTFTYQGRLMDGGTPANGPYDFRFTLWDTNMGGIQQPVPVPITVTLNNVQVTAGAYTVQLGFGNAFDGGNRFLEMELRPNGGGAFTVLAPRQQITATPYAIRSLASTSADTAANATQLGSVAANQYVLTGDARLTDPRPPTAGSSNYIQNATAPQTGNFNISGDGTLGGNLTVAGTLSLNTVNAQTQYNLGGQRVLGVDASGGNFYAGVGAGAVSSSRGPANTFVGFNAGAMNDTGQLNSFFGFRAGEMNVDGQSNAFFGTRAGSKNVFGGGNAFFGNGAGSNSNAFFNSFFGSGAGLSNTTGTRNSFFGVSGGFLNTTGTDNSFFGHVAGRNSTASNNSFFGSLAGQANTTGFDNAFFGQGAGAANQTGQENSFFGKSAGLQNTTGGQNSFFGINAGINNTAGGENAFFGATSGTNNTTGVANSFFGSQAGIFNTDGGFNSFFGRTAGLNNKANFNAFFGAGAGEANTTGTDNTFVGTSVGAANLIGSDNSFFGREAGRNNTASGNSFFGRSSGIANTTGVANAFFGYSAGAANETGMRNSFFGHRAGRQNTGDSNVFVGQDAGANNTSGGLNTVVGAISAGGCCGLVMTGSENAFFGFGVGSQNTSGGFNSFFGPRAGASNKTGQNNTLIGYLANVGVDGLTNATAIGSGAVVSQSNSLVLGNNANVGIGTPTPNSKLTVVGLIESTTGGVKFPDGTIQTTAGGGGAGVTSLNGLTNNVTLAAGSNVTITPAGNTLTIASTNGGGILNQTTLQTGANFNIGGTGTANVFNAATQYNIGGSKVLSAPGNDSLWIGRGAGGTPPTPGNANDDNTFVGPFAGANNSGCCNAFFGSLAGNANTLGSSNTFVGYLVGASNTEGNNNTFIGAGNNLNNTGFNNTFIGISAGVSNTAGSNNTAIGAGTNFGANNLTFATAIGANAVVSTSNTIVLGRTSDTANIPGNLVVTGTFSNPSDARLKTGIANLRYGLSEVLRLRPVTWTWKNDSPDRTRLGLIAQEVQPILPELIEQGSDKDRLLSMNYIGLLPIVIKAIQEQEVTITTLRKEIAGLQKQTTGGTADTSVGIGTPTPKAKLDVTGGNILVGSPGQGIILKSPDGVTCKLLSIDNAGAMVLAATACP